MNSDGRRDAAGNNGDPKGGGMAASHGADDLGCYGSKILLPSLRAEAITLFDGRTS